MVYIQSVYFYKSVLHSDVNDLIEREWMNLTPEQRKYLVQIRGPHDMFQFIVRHLATVANISTAAVLYDETFGNIQRNETRELHNQLISANQCNGSSDICLIIFA